MPGLLQTEQPSSVDLGYELQPTFVLWFTPIRSPCDGYSTCFSNSVWQVSMVLTIEKGRSEYCYYDFYPAIAWVQAKRGRVLKTAVEWRSTIVQQWGVEILYFPAIVTFDARHRFVGGIIVQKTTNAITFICFCRAITKFYLACREKLHVMNFDIIIFQVLIALVSQSNALQLEVKIYKYTTYSYYNCGFSYQFKTKRTEDFQKLF